jgi:hypothetical protein
MLHRRMKKSRALKPGNLHPEPVPLTIMLHCLLFNLSVTKKMSLHYKSGLSKWGLQLSVCSLGCSLEKPCPVLTLSCIHKCFSSTCCALVLWECGLVQMAAQCTFSSNSPSSHLSGSGRPCWGQEPKQALWEVNREGEVLLQIWASGESERCVCSK